PRGDTACRSEDVIVPVPLIKLWALNRWVQLMTVIDNHTLIQGFGCLGVHPLDGEDALDTCAASGIGVNQVRPAILVPEWTYIDDSFGGLHQYRFFPRACGIFGLDAVNAEIRIPVENIELTLMVSD